MLLVKYLLEAKQTKNVLILNEVNDAKNAFSRKGTPRKSSTLIKKKNAKIKELRLLTTPKQILQRIALAQVNPALKKPNK